jgi:hypothetical protein
VLESPAAEVEIDGGGAPWADAKGEIAATRDNKNFCIEFSADHGMTRNSARLCMRGFLLLYREIMMRI